MKRRSNERLRLEAIGLSSVQLRHQMIAIESVRRITAEHEPALTGVRPARPTRTTWPQSWSARGGWTTVVGRARSRSLLWR